MPTNLCSSVCSTLRDEILNCPADVGKARCRRRRCKRGTCLLRQPERSRRFADEAGRAQQHGSRDALQIARGASNQAGSQNAGACAEIGQRHHCWKHARCRDLCSAVVHRVQKECHHGPEAGQRCALVAPSDGGEYGPSESRQRVARCPCLGAVGEPYAVPHEDASSSNNGGSSDQERQDAGEQRGAVCLWSGAVTASVLQLVHALHSGTGLRS